MVGLHVMEASTSDCTFKKHTNGAYQLQDPYVGGPSIADNVERFCSVQWFKMKTRSKSLRIASSCLPWTEGR